MKRKPTLGNILIIDDDASVVNLLRGNLRSEGYTVSELPLTSALTRDCLQGIDIVIIDAANQTPNGLDTVSNIRRAISARSMGVIYCSAYSDSNTIIDALDAGADDCIAKPFSLREVMARVRAMMRRRRINSITLDGEYEVIKYKDLSIDPANKIVMATGAAVSLSLTEFSILEILMRNRGRYISREQLFTTIWPDGAASARIVDTNVSRLRRKLGECGAMIGNRAGLGYIIGE